MVPACTRTCDFRWNALNFHRVPVMSVCLPVKMSFRDRQFTYLVWNVVSSLIIYIWYTWCNVVSRCVFKKSINPYMFPTFWVCRHTSRVPSRRCIQWPDCYFYFRSNNVINSGQNCILYPTFNCINNIVHFSVNPFIKTPFQSFNIHCISINNWIITRSTNGKILVISAFNDHSILLSFTNGVANNQVLIEVIYLAEERSVCLSFLTSGNHFRFNNWFALRVEHQQ